MNDLEYVAGGAAAIAFAVGIMVSVATARGGTFGSRMIGIGIGAIALVTGLGLLFGAYQTNIGLLMPVIAGAAFVGVAGGLIYRQARVMHRR